MLITLSLLNVLINGLYSQAHTALDHLEDAGESVGLGETGKTATHLAASKLGKLAGLGGTGEGGYAPYLVCVQGRAVPWFLWTFLTAGGVEVKGFEVSA